MNQYLIQEKNQEKAQQLKQESQGRMLAKANFLVRNNKVRRSQCEESRNIWMVGSYSHPKRWYVVKWDQELKGFICACKAFEFSSEGMCLHIAAAALYEEKH